MAEVLRKIGVRKKIRRFCCRNLRFLLFWAQVLIIQVGKIPGHPLKNRRGSPIPSSLQLYEL
jgi:hypothetical protein